MRKEEFARCRSSQNISGPRSLPSHPRRRTSLASRRSGCYPETAHIVPKSLCWSQWRLVNGGVKPGKICLHKRKGRQICASYLSAERRGGRDAHIVPKEWVDINGGLGESRQSAHFFCVCVCRSCPLVSPCATCRPIAYQFQPTTEAVIKPEKRTKKRIPIERMTRARRVHPMGHLSEVYQKVCAGVNVES